MAAALDNGHPDDLPTFDVSGTTTKVGQAVGAVFAAYRGAEPMLSAWLRDDVLALADVYGRATGARSMWIRLETVRGDMCRAFHVDDVSFRLVTTYRGPGTEWIPPRSLANALASQPIDAAFS